MEKKVVKAFGKKVYLLGADDEGTYYWLEEPSWDCGWYWGFGYVETYTNNQRPSISRDIKSHQHWDGLIMNKNICYHDAFKELFIETPLTDDEIWTLTDYMKSFYTLREAAELIGRGYSHQTERAKIDKLKDDELCNRINKEMLPALFEKITTLLTPTEKQD